MASSKRKQQDKPSVRAVLVYAAKLRDQADVAKARDPHVELYRPSHDAARKVSQQFGPERALVVLATRARRAELRYEEAGVLADAGRERLVRLQLIVSGERDADRERLSLGERLDAAFLGLDVLSEVDAVRLDSEPVKGSRGGGGTPFRQRREVELLEGEARLLIERAERELERSRRRLLELEAA